MREDEKMGKEQTLQGLKQKQDALKKQHEQLFEQILVEYPPEATFAETDPGVDDGETLKEEGIPVKYTKIDK